MIKLVVLDVDGTSIDRDNHFYDDDIKERALNLCLLQVEI